MKDSDLIGRSDARAAFCKVCAYNEVCDKKKRGDDWCCPAMDNIDSIPAVDAVEVVRCRECVKADDFGHCEMQNFWGTRDDFCSRGQRREDGDA